MPLLTRGQTNQVREGTGIVAEAQLIAPSLETRSLYGTCWEEAMMPRTHSVPCIGAGIDVRQRARVFLWLWYNAMGLLL
ncbi:hypothetical protein Efla_007051 [Eimeria flavescens]